MKHYNFEIDNIFEDELFFEDEIINEGLLQKIWAWLKRIFSSRSRNSYGYYDYPEVSNIRLGDYDIETGFDNGNIKSKTKFIPIIDESSLKQLFNTTVFKSGEAFPVTEEKFKKGIFKKDSGHILYLLTSQKGNYDILVIDDYTIDNTHSAYNELINYGDGEYKNIKKFHILSIEFNEAIRKQFGINDNKNFYKGIINALQKKYNNSNELCIIVTINKNDQQFYNLIDNYNGFDINDKNTINKLLEKDSINKPEENKPEEKPEENKPEEKSEEKPEEKPEENSKEKTIKNLVNFYNLIIKTKYLKTKIKNGLFDDIEDTTFAYDNLALLKDEKDKEAKVKEILLKVYNDLQNIDIKNIKDKSDKDDIENLQQIFNVNSTRLKNKLNINESLQRPYKSLYSYIKEGLDDENILWLIDKWFDGKDDDREAFMSLVNDCIVNKNTSKDYIEKETQSTIFDEQYLKEFINFIHNDVNIKIDEPYYQLSKIIKYLIDNKSKNNKYIKENL